MSFHETMTAADRRLAQRLEGLCDVVVGFAMSQLVFRLPQLEGRELAETLVRLGLYIGTFAILVLLWLSFHRMVTAAFVPTRFDLFLVFTYLAFTSLMPYAMNAYFTFTVSASETHLGLTTFGLAAYTICYLGTLASGALIRMRNLRRGWAHLTFDERTLEWKAFLRLAILAGIMLAVTILDWTIGPELASVLLALIPFPLTYIRRRIKAPPSSALLRIPAEARTV